VTTAFLKKSQLNSLLETVRGFGELHAPVITEAGVTSFAPLTDSGSLCLDYQRTQIPPKKYLFPFRDKTLRYRDGIYAETESAAAEIILFGIHPCDLDGIAYLDRVFLGERPDRSYAQRRARLTLIGLSCDPDGFCFCSGSCSSPSCDLFLNTAVDGFEMSGFTARGEAIMAAAASVLTTLENRVAVERLPSPIPPQDPQLRFSDNPRWEEFAKRCLSCGACSVCCPTCYCFDLREYPTLSGGGERLREWDNCFFVTHGEVAGGNFRPTRLDRIRYRFLHKYCGFTPLDGMTSCVGCGRCRKVCPVEIDLRELLNLKAVTTEESEAITTEDSEDARRKPENG
jgi:sulfhydrogenase subunit beta (sulfur reductase)